MTWDYAWRWQYARQWDDLLDEPMEPLTGEEARARHESGELYTAYHLDEDGVISIVVEVGLGSGYVGVKNFDRYARLACYQVLDRRGDRMFMVGASWYDYGDSTEHLLRDEAEDFHHLTMEPDGAGCECRGAGEDPDEECPVSIDEDSSAEELWAPVPEFGDYTRVCLVGVDREKAAEIMAEYDREKRPQDSRNPQDGC